MGLNLEGRRIVKILKRSPEKHVDTDLQELFDTRTAVGEASKYRLSISSTNMRNASETVIRTIASGLDRISDYTTSSTNHRPRSMTCVCFAKPSSLGVTEPFLTQKPG